MKTRGLTFKTGTVVPESLIKAKELEGLSRPNLVKVAEQEGLENPDELSSREIIKVLSEKGKA